MFIYDKILPQFLHVNAVKKFRYFLHDISKKHVSKIFVKIHKHNLIVYENDILVLLYLLVIFLCGSIISRRVYVLFSYKNIEGCFSPHDKHRPIPGMANSFR